MHYIILTSANDCFKTVTLSSKNSVRPLPGSHQKWKFSGQFSFSWVLWVLIFILGTKEAVHRKNVEFSEQTLNGYYMLDILT